MKLDSAIALTMWLAVLAVPTACAQTAAWTNVGPNGGSIRLTIDPGDPTTFYAGTGTGLFKSTDRGATWNIAGLSGWSVGSLFIDPQDTSTLYAQAAFAPDENTDISKVFKSTDRGATWNDLVSGAMLLAIDPRDSNTLYALAGGYPQGLFKSTDGGAGWARLSGLPANFYIAGFAIDPQNHNTLYVPVQGASAGRAVVAVYRSVDGGANWRESDSGLPDAGNGQTAFVQGAIAIDPKNPGTVYVTRAGIGVYKSADAGTSWRAANAGLPNLVGDYEFMSCCGSGVVIDPQNTNTLYVSGQNPTNPIIYKSTNGGSSWRAVSSGLWPGLLGYGSNLSVDPQDSNTVYVSTGIGLFRSTDGAATFDRYSWPRATAIGALMIDPQNSGTLYTGGYKSTDGGMSWIETTSGIPPGSGIVALAIDPQTPGNVYAATNMYECGNTSVVGIFKSVDGAMSWTDTKSGIGCGLSALAIDPQTPATIYAGHSYRGVYKSMDAGATWTSVNSGLPSGPLGPNVNALAVDPQNSGTLYCSSGGGLYKSTDGGTGWSRTGLASAATALAIDPQTAGTLFAVTPGGLSKSTDGGASWRNLSVPAATNVYAVAIHPQTSSTIFAGTDTGVAQSTDGGESWTAIPGGPANVRVVALDPQAPHTVYAGGPAGLFAISFGP